MSVAGRRIEIRGVVQGVGFRPWIWRLARENGVAGRVSNDSRGVTIDAFGLEAALESFLSGIRSAPPPAAEIRALDWRAIPAEPVRDFLIVASRTTESLEVSIPPDRATCDECVREVFDLGDRRFRYAFTNCTDCGPRFTICREVPYDRQSTSMAPFAMCALCQAEYEDPGNRRFHAQPNACPACGPALSWLSSEGVREPVADPLAEAAAHLRAGWIVAVKGLGGFHLAADAGSSEAVGRLRLRKRREEKPFAVMVEGIESAETLALLSEEERKLLLSPERPIVLARRRPGSGIAPEVAPDNPHVGLILPYTPLHHLLISEAGRPLVMTSGNVSDEPLAAGNSEAVTRLAGIADGFLVHDREIASRCDDSVVRVIARGPVLLRRSRGWVPRPIPVAVPFDEPVLACGGQLKNTFCVGVGSLAYLGPHVGDLDNLATLEAYEDAIDRMVRFLGVEPSIIAHDLHPQYVSTVYARSRRGRKVAVQHHHAHVVSAMAEHGLEGPVLGVAYDGTGYGPDGTAWGGELMFAERGGFERLATFRPIALAGGDTAIAEPWRIAVALIEDAYPDGPPRELDRFLEGVDHRALDLVRQVLRCGLELPRARGVGRYFDAFGSLFLGRPFSRHEGQVAMAWNFAADPAEDGTYPFEVDRSVRPPELDLRPTLRAALRHRRSGAGVAQVSGRFHNTLARATAELVAEARESAGDVPVVLTGGCFQNRLLAERAVEAVEARGGNVFLHRRVPPGDGGLSLGQAVAAAARVRGEMR
jgi:hydrogenase maturation protein HypF